MLPRGLGPAPTAEGVPWADGGAPGHRVCFPALGATSAGCTGCGATARVDEGAQRAPHPNGLSVEEGGGGGQGSAGGCLASRGHPQLHWSARGCAGLGVCDEVGGARAHLEVPWAGRSRDTHSGQAVSPAQPPLLGPEGADSVHPSRRGRRLGGGGGRVVDGSTCSLVWERRTTCWVTMRVPDPNILVARSPLPEGPRSPCDGLQ